MGGLFIVCENRPFPWRDLLDQRSAGCREPMGQRGTGRSGKGEELEGAGRGEHYDTPPGGRWSLVRVTNFEGFLQKRSHRLRCCLR